MILGSATTRWQFETVAGPKLVLVEGRVRSNNVLTLREAALAGLGVAVLPHWLIVNYVKAKRLVRSSESAVAPRVSVVGLVHIDAPRSNAVRLVQDFLATELPRSLGEAPRLVIGKAPGQSENVRTRPRRKPSLGAMTVHAFVAV